MLPLYATCGTEFITSDWRITRNESKSSRKLPDNPPTQFIKKRWQKLIHTDNGINVNYYELCVLSELKNALRSGDIWVQGSRQFKAFDEYLMTTNTFETLLQTKKLPIAIETDCKTYLQSRLNLLGAELKQTNKLAKDEELPEATIKATTGLKVTPLDAVLPESVQNLITKVSRMLPLLRSLNCFWKLMSGQGLAISLPT